MAIQATALGLVMHQMAGFEPPRAVAQCGIPAGYEAVVAIALGHAGDPEALPEAQHARELGPRLRRTQAEFVFGDGWATPLGRAGGPSEPS